MAALTRSGSLTNLPVTMNPRTGFPEDLRDTWVKKCRKTASLQGAKVIEFNNIFEQKKNDQPAGTSICAEPVMLESDPFLLCGNIWTVKVYPYGVDEDSEFLSIKLQNKSEDIINAYYSFSIKRTTKPYPEDEQRLNFWADPGACVSLCVVCVCICICICLSLSLCVLCVRAVQQHN